ncbi:MAG TPA: GFA family protein [Gaiellaceae bacterium]|nr:GFA family protein [Gaiellaceae bacterium]
MTLRGACACGATEYEVEDAFVYAMNCHCSNCRASTGSAYKPMAGIQREKLKVTREDVPMFVWGKEHAGDYRCGVCGSFLYSVVREGKWVHVTLGSLRDTPSKLPDHHIFVGSKAEWEVIGDDLPQHDEYAH